MRAVLSTSRGRRACLFNSMRWFAAFVLANVVAFANTACGGTSNSSMPAQATTARARFVDGAPELETIIAGRPQPIGSAYLQMNGSTVASSFAYGTFTSFVTVNAGSHELTARNEEGYSVGPLKTAPLTGGDDYTLVVVGSYPNYRVLTFEEPQSTSGAQLSFYEASPAVPAADFGGFRASTKSNFKELGSAHLGNIVTVSLGGHVSDFGGFVGPANAPTGTVKPSQINAFDSRNVLPFHRAARLSLFLFDSAGSSIGPVFGSLDR
jgi:hypothetical protein